MMWAEPVGWAGTLFVSPSGTHLSPFATWESAATNIQAAVGAAAGGDTVLVTNGTYVLSTQISIPTGITVASVNGAAFTTVDGTGSTRCFSLRHTNAMIDGFTITGGAASRGGGVRCDRGGTVQNCIIYFNTHYYYGPSNHSGLGSYAFTCTTPLVAGVGNFDADLINEVWVSVSGYENLPGTGAEIAYTNPVPQATESYRVKVRLAG